MSHSKTVSETACQQCCFGKSNVCLCQVIKLDRLLQYGCDPSMSIDQKRRCLLSTALMDRDDWGFTPSLDECRTYVIHDSLSYHNLRRNTT